LPGNGGKNKGARSAFCDGFNVKIASIDKPLSQADFKPTIVVLDAFMTTAPLIPDASEPFGLFGRWFDDARAKEPDLPEAMSLATATPDGKPSVRLVLLKEVSPRGFVFYTNAESRKGQEIAANPAAALCFHWKSLGRQVRAEGVLSQVTSAEADAYWATRPRQSQLAGWASEQSRILPSRELLQTRIDEFDARFAGRPVPRPAQWTGFRLAPQTVEFWHDVRDRLHDRLVFHRQGESWRTERLYP
jgi:pyridoxamine 5'-phosphate oxidase